MRSAFKNSLAAILLCVGLAFVQCACCNITDHPWQARPSLPGTLHSSWSGVSGQSRRTIDQWEEIPAQNIHFVSSTQKREAIRRLTWHPYVLLSKQEFTKWNIRPEDVPTTASAYLMRGLSYRSNFEAPGNFNKPDCIHVFRQKDTNEVWVQQALYNDYFSLYSVIAESPVVVILDQPPAKVSVTAHVGEDSILSGHPRICGSDKSIAFGLVGK